MPIHPRHPRPPVFPTLSSIVLAFSLTACVSAPPLAPFPHPAVEARPPESPRPAITPLKPETPVALKPAASEPPSAVTTPSMIEPPTVSPPIRPAPSDAERGQALLQQLLPPGIKDRNGWRTDIFNAFSALRIPYEAPYFCAALSVIEQESGWQSDPVVPNLDQMVWKEVGKRAGKYHVPLLAVKAALLKPSPNGRSYKARIDALRTETEMNALFEDIVADARKLGLPVTMKNPIRTGGPMQVGVEFAEGQVKVWPYPYRMAGSIRSEVFTRRGGVYFGIADLLQYRVDYPDMIYRFADYNAGRYSSRNAAFQAAVARLSRKPLTLDGDLLNYDSAAPGLTQQRVLALAPMLGLSPSAVRADLKLEKSEAFAQTAVYRRVFERADARAGAPAARQILPQIRLDSPKITRKLTTEWFAKRVDGRYRACLARVPAVTSPAP